MFILLTLRLDGFTQFYNGVQQVFGKNRVQYQEFDWSYYKFNRFKVYSYTGGMELAQLVAKKINPIISDLENKFEFVIEDDLNFIIYNNINHFRQKIGRAHV